MMSKYGKTYTITIIGRSGSVHYGITEWHINDDTNLLEFTEHDKTIITTHTYVIAED